MTAKTPAPDLTAEEFSQLLAGEVRDLQPDVLPKYDRYRIATARMKHRWEHQGQELSAPVWVVARAGDTVLGYDELEKEFGIGAVRDGTVAEGGVVDDWSTFGARLRWTLLRFPALGR